MEQATSRKHHPVIGIAWMLTGAFLFSVADALGKALSANIPVVQITWLRCVIAIILVGLFVALRGGIAHLKTARPGWHFFRSIVGMMAMLSIFYSLSKIPLAEFTAIVFAQPFILSILSFFLLGENISRQSWIAIVIGFAGILFVARPSPDHFHIAHLVTLITAFSLACLAVTARYLSTTESVYSLNFYIYPVTIVSALYWTLTTWVQPTTQQWLMIAGLGFTATVAFGCVVQAMRSARPSVVAPIDYSRLVWAVLFGFWFWNDFPDTYTWMGVALIFGSGIYVASHAHSTRKRHTSD